MSNNESENTTIVVEEKMNSMLVRLGVLGGLLMLSLFVFNSSIFTIESTTAVATPVKALPTLISPFEHVTVEAKAAYVYDVVNEEILFAKNERSQLPLASVTKLMTALVASELISEGTIITIGEDSVAVDGDNGFHVDEHWKFKDLLDYTLLVSSNDGAHAIASVAGSFSTDTAQSLEGKSSNQIFIDKMNQTAVSLGLTQSYFINESGLDRSTLVGGGYGSARDIASLLAYIIFNRPGLLEATAYENLNFISEDQFVYNATNTNSAVGNIPGLLASKTGYTDLAGGNLAIAFDAGINHPIVAVVLGSSFEGRFRDIEKLVDASLEEMAQ
ncbi:D-alanyl-D-alanine carboxypeptidase [Candidatus Kaiserbacteria bacterium]|nr:D-alanyl-D-alanine carboxypeptidase [Candidatus Kaiserbacteria bacterium]